MPSALPSVMQIKKAKLEAKQVTLPAMESMQRPTLKPVVVNSQVEKKEEKKDEKKEEELDLKQFAVEPEEKKESEVVTPEPQKVEVKVEKKEGEDDDESKRDWRWMYKSLEGNHKTLVEENRQLRDKFVELETRFSEFSKKPEVKVNEPALDLTEEELQEYGAALPVLNKLLTKERRNIEQSVIKPLQQEILELKKSNTDVVQKAAASDEGTFVQQVRMQVKNVGGDFDAILKNPKWAEFTNRAIGPYADITIGQALWDAHKKRDLGKVIKVFEDFAKTQTTNGAGDAYRAPSVSAAAGALPESNEKKPMLKWSKRKEASDKFRKRQISMDEYNQIAKVYRDAEAEGRIDFSK